MDPRVSKWLSMSRGELDEVYRAAGPGNLPTGDTRGTAILTAAGGFLAKIVAFVARCLAWQGKVFDVFAPPDRGILINKVTPFSLTFVVAKVYKDDSWLDGKPTIVIDYSRTSFFAKKIRDEIREIEPGVWLGKVWFGRTRILDFALVAKQARSPRTAPALTQQTR
ncbi:MAG: hypothetical protein KDE27_04165 [Planctomycetes bacterium]|nr:hypothetical protein [Planctomycetota bacterium]